MAPKLESVTGTELINPPWARRTAQLDSLLTQCSLPTGPHSHGGESRADADSTSWLAAVTFPKEFPLRLGKMLKTMLRARKGQAAHRGAQAEAPSPGSLAAGSPSQQSLTPL